MGRSPRHADVRHSLAALLLAVGLFGCTAGAAAQRVETSSLKPIAVTPPPGAPAPDRAAPAKPPEPDSTKQQVIATTQSPAAAPLIRVGPTLIQPVAVRPEPARPSLTNSVMPAPLPALATPPAIRGVGLLVEKLCPAAVAPGQPCTYEIIVRNAGASWVFGVRVEDQLVSGARCLGGEPNPLVHGERLVWELGTLQAGAEHRLKVEVQAAVEDTLAAPVVVTFSNRASVRPLPRPLLELTVTGPERVPAGGLVPLQMKVSNRGTGPAANVTIHNTLPAGLRHPEGSEVVADLGTLAPGQSETLTLDAVAVQPGRLVNRASVVADGAEPAAVETGITVVGTTLQVRLSGPAEAETGRELDYLLQGVNTGPAPALAPKMTVSLPEGLEFVSAGAGGSYQASERTVEWALGLPDGGSRTVPLKVRARVPGDQVIRVRFAAEDGLEAKSELCVQVAGPPPLLLEVADPGDPVKEGAEATYEVRVPNQSSAVASGIRVTATVPDGLAVLEADGPGTHRREGQQVQFEPVPQLAPGADLLFRVRVKGKQPGDWRFRVEVASEQLTQPLRREESTRVLKP